jgi:protein MAK11
MHDASAAKHSRGASPCRSPPCCCPTLQPTAAQNDKDLGFLMSPGEGAVTALAFFTPAGAYNPTHLLSGSADGSMRCEWGLPARCVLACMLADRSKRLGPSHHSSCLHVWAQTVASCPPHPCSVWQAGGGWECMKTLRAHRKEVAAICVHPSGLIALSVGRYDRC